MYFNLALFGNKVRRLRKKLKLTQSDVSEATGVNIETIRRIEAGKVLPRLDTLEYLSPALKEDLQSMLMKCRLDDYAVFLEIQNRIEQKFDKDDIDTLHMEYNELLCLRKSTNNEYYRVAIDQLLIFISAALSYKKDNNPELALHKLIMSIKKTTDGFTLDNYQRFAYTELEIRILMHIAMILNVMGKQEQYLKMLTFCANHANQHEKIYPKVLYNLAGAYLRGKNYGKAMEYTTRAIHLCNQTRNYTGLHLLYYNKALCEFRLGKGDYRDSLNKAIFLCDIYGYTSLKKRILLNCKEVFRIKDDLPQGEMGQPGL